MPLDASQTPRKVSHHARRAEVVCDYPVDLSPAMIAARAVDFNLEPCHPRRAALRLHPPIAQTPPPPPPPPRRPPRLSPRTWRPLVSANVASSHAPAWAVPEYVHSGVSAP